MHCYIKKLILFPLVRKTGSQPVVASQSVNSRFNQNESVLGVLIFAAFLEVASDVDGLLDHAVDILRNFRSASYIHFRVPFFLSRRTIFCPVSNLMLGTASLSLMATPICEGDIPFLAMVTMSSEMDLGVCATQRADLLLKGVTAELIPFPFPLLWILPMMTTILFFNNLLK